MRMSDWFIRHRQDWIKETLQVFGFINREHLERKFGVSTPQASELVGYCANRGMTVDKTDVIALDDLINIEAPQPERFHASDINDLQMLMKFMAQGTQKIEAIRLHRQITGWGLKESKDAVEAVWIDR
jgi:ribosomal protein L7/L12